MTAAPTTPSRLAHATAALVGAVTRAPWLTLVGCAFLVGLAIAISATHLKYLTQRNDLLSPDKPCQQRWQRYLDAFGDEDDLIVVIEGRDRGRMMSAADRVAAELRTRSDLFDRVFHHVDLRTLHSRSLLYLSIDELEQLRRRLEGMSPLLGGYGNLGWTTVSLQALLTQAVLADQRQRQGKTLSPADADLLKLLPTLMQSAADTLRNPAAYRNPWAVGGDRTQANQLAEPQYFFTPDGQLALVLARPTKADHSFTPAQRANTAARKILATVRGEFPDLQLGLTGLPVLETDEMAASDEDSMSASWIALVGVAVLYFVVYRGARYPLLTIGTLLIGTAWALGWATLTIGHLNILSTTFAVMIIGMGDYGVLWVARYDEERRYGRTVGDALRETALHVGPSILTAAFTTSLAFFATMLADFQAVAELGWIAGCGVLWCALACLTFLPAMLMLSERDSEHAAERAPITIDAGRTFLPILSRRPRLVLGVGAVLVIACSSFGSRVQYDANLLNMQAAELDSVAWEHKLIRHAAGATWDAMSIAPTREDALKLKAQYESLPGVGRVVEAASLVPDEQAKKLPIISAIHDQLTRLPPMVSDPISADPLAVRELLAKLSQPHAELLTLLRAEHAEPLRDFDRRLRADLLADLRMLYQISHPVPITVHDLPTSFRERYIGSRGEWLVRAYATESLWQFDKLEDFTTQAATVDIDATGKSYRTLEGLRQMKSGFERAGLLALIVIVVVLWLEFRSFDGVLLGLFPLAVGFGLTLGVMGLFGVPLNPANLIALPLIVGVGVDNGVHVLHDYADRVPGKLYRLGAATGRGILVAALTTILGFGTLTIARHRGMASLGFTLTLGVSFCMIAALVLLPAMLRLRDDRRLHAKPNSAAKAA